MSQTDKSKEPEVDRTGQHLPSLSRRRTLGSFGLAMAAAPFAAPTYSQAQASRAGEPALRHVQNKRVVVEFLAQMASVDRAVAFRQYCHPDCRFEIFHPFNTLVGAEAAEAAFWGPLRTSFPNHEHRIAFTIAGDYEGREMVSTWGQVMGTFDEPWIGIPPTKGLTYLRFGFAAIVSEGKIAKAYVLLDIVDVMRQAGFYPLREMPGSAEAWPFPPQDTGATARGHDALPGEKSLRIVREMQAGLPKPDEIKLLATQPGNHSPHWHENMNWYGPAGIGSGRGLRGFRDVHGALFLQAFPDRGGWRREPGGPQDAPGHYMRLGDGRYACTGGWPSLKGTHLGGEWLGLPPTGRKVEMRVADWYRLDEDDKIIDNWVMMDIPHILQQMGLDLFHDLRFRVDRSVLRRPLQPS
jgi:predicted ester cyclase